MGSLTFEPVPEDCRGMTPAVDVVVPSPPPTLETEPKEAVLEEDELKLAVEELTMAELTGIEVTAPVELKVKVC